MLVETLNYLLALGTVLLQIAAAALLAVYFLRKRFPDLEDIAAFLSSWGLWIGLALTVGGTAINFYYADILGFTACWHCWVQRIFFTSQAVLFGVALWKKDRSIADYSIALSCFGALDALYHHALQLFPESGLPCPAAGVSCAKITFLEFGYITYPMMALSSFAFLFVVMLFVRKRS